MMVKIKELPALERPIERLIHQGTSNLTNEELLAILLKTGSKGKSAKEIASQILKEVENIQDLKHCTMEKYMKIKGVGIKKAAILLASLELGKRVLNPVPDIYQMKIKSSDEVVAFYQAFLSNKEQEYFCCLYLDIQKRVIKNKVLFKGSLTYSMVHPREVFKEAYLIGACSIICIHNHPSGSIFPSKNDINLTNQLIEAGNLLGIQVLDHLIIGKDNYYSFLENGNI